ncbi:MAG: HAD-IA family hydrolase [Candidatus Saccharimonadales bacterium]
MKHVIFDFDGTLVNSLPVAVSIAEEMVPGIDLSDKQLAQFREMPAREIIKASGIPYWKLLRLLIKGKKILGAHLDELKVFPGIEKVVKDLHKQGFQLSVVSSNSQENIHKVLKSQGIDAYFSGVYGNVGLFAKSRVFKLILKDQKVLASQCVYVGDEVRDIESSRKGGLPIVSVTWGYNGKKILSSYEPTYMADTPQQLYKIITEQVHIG